jgi:hypothetical protein
MPNSFGRIRNLFICIFVVIFLSVLVTPLTAGQKLVPRKILALYKGSENRTEEVNELTLDDLLAGITDENLHHEIDAGPAVGNEVW